MIVPFLLLLPARTSRSASTPAQGESAVSNKQTKRRGLAVVDISGTLQLDRAWSHCRDRGGSERPRGFEASSHEAAGSRVARCGAYRSAEHGESREIRPSARETGLP
jgi:hypothetical protein